MQITKINNALVHTWHFKTPLAFSFPSAHFSLQSPLAPGQRVRTCYSGCTLVGAKYSLQPPHFITFLPFLALPFTLPAVVADAELLSGQVTVTVIWAATVVSAVRDVTGFSFPVLITLTVHAAQHRICCDASAMARAVVGTRVYPGGDTIREEVLQGYTDPLAQTIADCYF